MNPETIEIPEDFLNGDVGLDEMFVKGNRNTCNMRTVDKLSLEENPFDSKKS